MTDFIALACTAISTEQEALETLKQELDSRFNDVCQTVLACTGRVVVTGMGKSGHIGRKIAATLASTGTPAFFMHPGEAGHGDLGMLVRGDVLIAISNSGQSDEIKMLLPAVKQLAIPLITISKDRHGTLPAAADIALTLGASKEACPLGLAPTSSTTATLALGDALAIALLYARGFSENDFAMSHPAGALGRKLLTHVQDLMHTEQLPLVESSTSLNDTLLVMTSGRLGLAVVTEHNTQTEVVGIFTDGDLRRRLAVSPDLTVAIGSIMTTAPKTIAANVKATVALQVMQQHRVNQLLVMDGTRLLGIVTLQDLMQAGIY